MALCLTGHYVPYDDYIHFLQDTFLLRLLGKSHLVLTVYIYSVMCTWVNVPVCVNVGMTCLLYTSFTNKEKTPDKIVLLEIKVSNYYKKNKFHEKSSKIIVWYDIKMNNIQLLHYTNIVHTAFSSLTS